LAGFSDDKQQRCFALALWNSRDPILKRLFGLTNSEGNHGEDVKEYYFYLYKYPQAAYLYSDLVETNKRRSRDDFEYELLDTGVFEENRTARSARSSGSSRYHRRSSGRSRSSPLAMSQPPRSPSGLFYRSNVAASGEASKNGAA
jgi:hypothetical protein